MTHGHPTNETIELYCFQRLTPFQSIAVEEHALACELCRRRVETELAFFSAIRQAAFSMGLRVPEGQIVARASA